jgi:uncharacterized RDD family membrane protein YckC
MKPRTLSDEPLHVRPELIGVALASPIRRACAFALDLALIVVPSLFLALSATALSLSLSDPQAFGGIRTLLKGKSLDEQGRKEAIKSIIPILVRHEMPGMPNAAKAAFEEGKLQEAYDLIRDYDYEFSLQFGEIEPPSLKPGMIRVQIGELIPKSLRFLALYGLAAVYFSLLSSTRRGATIGKRILGIRIVRLDGHRLSIWESLERFVGYLHIPATLGIPILDLWRDHNRRMPHDRSAHTAVIRATGKA